MSAKLIVSLITRTTTVFNVMVVSLLLMHDACQLSGSSYVRVLARARFIVWTLEVAVSVQAAFEGGDAKYGRRGTEE